jgi:hypothetical protein
MGETGAQMCPFGRSIDIKLEISGENTCSRWHQDRYVARAIVSYTGIVGTEYTNDPNVDFWELENCGKNECVIRDKRQVFGVDVGDFLLIKGTLYPTGASGLVHKAPEKRYHPDGRVIQRLCLKVDVPELADTFDYEDEMMTPSAPAWPLTSSRTPENRVNRAASSTARQPSVPSAKRNDAVSKKRALRSQKEPAVIDGWTPPWHIKEDAPRGSKDMPMNAGAWTTVLSVRT